MGKAQGSVEYRFGIDFGVVWMAFLMFAATIFSLKRMRTTKINPLGR